MSIGAAAEGCDAGRRDYLREWYSERKIFSNIGRTGKFAGDVGRDRLSGRQSFALTVLPWPMDLNRMGFEKVEICTNVTTLLQRGLNEQADDAAFAANKIRRFSCHSGANSDRGERGRPKHHEAPCESNLQYSTSLTVSATM